MRTLQNHIDGRWVDSSGADTITRLNPYHETPVAVLPAGTAEDADTAVRAAERAQPAWAALNLPDRLARLRHLAALVEKNVDDLAAMETEEMGKPRQIAAQFIHAGLTAFTDALHHAESYRFAHRVKVVDGVATDVQRFPVGVVALIVPWNFTVTTILMTLGQALAAGNTVVVKPSEKASISAVGFFELVDQAGLPAGAVNLLLGDGHSGAPLAGHPGIDLVHFTGSVRTGRSVATAAAANFNRALLELGGKDPVVVDSDVDVHAVAEEVAVGSYLNSGQICTAMERIYVHQDVAEPFVDALVAATRRQVVGDPADPGTQIGPMVDGDQRQLVHRQVEAAVAAGARVLVGGEVPEGPGWFYPPTVVVDVRPEMELMCAETFGPVAAVQVVPSFEAGVEEAKRTEFGLAATVYTADADHRKLACSIPTGVLWLGGWQLGDLGRLIEPAGVSGMGASGGVYALDAMTRPTSVSYVVHAVQDGADTDVRGEIS
ncbi:Aldehyde dehydrogenase (EC [Amycolatopsis camponoti]|uniref:aldehyde dehydrogenase (NAD(+)) n=1 Tax=Amycolatopsis camponoti TaxID=2606593 RepID=A0A6I8M1M2_9PSEU|nr:aldehyde dehydrogenase family protein [Amycolatopsis camponoti]VVJ21862.1 Aldehyde dehydrogenase (EC [Amycolatopsis camponoti]